MRGFLATLLLAVPILVAAPASGAGGDKLADPATCRGCWDPKPTTQPWQWQLQGRIDLSVKAPVYDVDMDVGAGNVRRIHAQGDKAVCYVDVGSWEPYRTDAGEFPKRILGRHFPGFPNERWLDIRALGVLKPILRKRFDTCAAKGFDGVEADNVDGYANRTGFPLTATDQLRFDTWFANAVRQRGMAIGLKNDLGQVAKLLPYFDFAVNEQCFQYHECNVLERFVRAGKPVFGAEYELSRSQFCAKSKRLGFSTIRKRYSLRAWRQTC